MAPPAGSDVGGASGGAAIPQPPPLQAPPPASFLDILSNFAESVG